MGCGDSRVTDAAATRLIPRWFTRTVLSGLTVFVAMAFGLSLAFDGALGWSFRAMFVFVALLLVAAVSSLARPRRHREPMVAADGTRTFLAPAATVWPLVGAMVAMMAVAVMWAYVAVTDFDSLESPGFTLVTIVAAVGAIPDFGRLVSGRLHRWRLELGPEIIRYRGYRTDLAVPWSKVHGARIQARGPAGVLIDVKGAEKDPVVPITAFAVPAEQLIEEIERAQAAARR